MVKDENESLKGKHIWYTEIHKLLTLAHSEQKTQLRKAK